MHLECFTPFLNHFFSTIYLSRETLHVRSLHPGSGMRELGDLPADGILVQAGQALIFVSQ